MENESRHTVGSLARDLAFEIVYGGDRFDKDDIENAIKESGVDRDQLADSIRKVLKEDYPRETLDRGTGEIDNFHSGSVEYWVREPESK